MDSFPIRSLFDLLGQKFIYILGLCLYSSLAALELSETHPVSGFYWCYNGYFMTNFHPTVIALRFYLERIVHHWLDSDVTLKATS